MLDLFIDGIAAIATPDTLALMILGVIVGIIFGSVPGLTAVTGIALFLPVTYSRTARTANCKWWYSFAETHNRQHYERI